MLIIMVIMILIKESVGRYIITSLSVPLPVAALLCSRVLLPYFGFNARTLTVVSHFLRRTAHASQNWPRPHELVAGVELGFCGAPT